jgi:hypothetical protein
MSESLPTFGCNDATLRAFVTELATWLPFREDALLLSALVTEVEPVLSALGAAYRTQNEPCTRPARTALSEGFALFNLLCRRAGLLGTTPTACLALARAVMAALRSEGLPLSEACADDLSVIAVEGFSAGRDELRERSLRTIAIESQVLVPLAARSFLVVLAGSLLAEPLERLLEDFARQLFRAEARSVLLDVSRLCEHGEDQARAIVAFASTLSGLGVDVLIYDKGASFDAWFAQLDLTARGVQRGTDFAEGLTRVLALGGYELRARGRLGELIHKVRTGAR